jgi:hypothetical protein
MKTKATYGIVSVLLAASQAMAVPTLYPRDFNLLAGIQNPTNSNLIADDKDIQTVYVMPPNEGYSFARGFHTPNAQLLFCPNLKKLADQSGKLIERAEVLRTKQSEQIDALNKMDEKILKAKLEQAEFETSANMGGLAKIDGDINTANTSLGTLYTKLDTCTESCDALMADVKVLQTQVRELTKARTEFVKANLKAVQQIEKKKAAVEALEEQRDKVLEAYDNLLEKLNKAQGEITTLFSTYGNMEGGRAAFAYRSDLEGNMVRLRELNPGINFQYLPTEKVNIYPALLGVQGLTGGSAIQRFEAPNVTTSTTGASIQVASYPPSLDGNAVLSLLGACPMVHPELFPPKANANPQEMKYGMLISYEYPAIMNLKMKATYNMYKLYSLVKSSGSSGGLFSSKSWSTTEERTFFRDAFRVEWNIEDPGNSISDEQRIAMEREARAELLGRLMGIGLPQMPDKSLFSNALPPPTRGSVVVADSLMQACPGNVYCMAGSFILKGLDAIFGSSSSSSSYTNIQDAYLEAEWNYNKTVMKPWITNYRAQ